LVGHRLDRFTAAVESHDATLLGAQFGRSADVGGVEREVQLGRDKALTLEGRPDRLDDHAGILALHQVAECSSTERLPNHVGLRVRAHQHDLHAGGLERRDLQGDGDVVLEVEVEQHDVHRELGVRQQFWPRGESRDHRDVVCGVADPLGESAEKHLVVIDECETDGSHVGSPFVGAAR